MLSRQSSPPHRFMLPDLLPAFITYAFVTSITPGPNNTMLLASGVNHGFARSVPHILGTSLGFGAMVLGVGTGLGKLFLVYPVMYATLRIVGALYLLWLAWQIATAQPMKDGAATGRPFGFWKAVTFQWVNPKSWVMAMGAITTYVPADGGPLNVAIIALVFSMVNMPCCSTWVGFGSTLRHWLTNRRLLRIFNITMAILLVLSLYPLLS